MTPQEKDLIQNVFERLARVGNAPKDSAADSLIRDLASRQPNALYGLVQAVIVQEMGLSQAQQRIDDLQRRLDETRGGDAQGGGFLGAAAGSPWGGGSVPRSGLPPASPAWNQPAGYAPPPPAHGAPLYAGSQGGAWGGGPWGGGGGGAGGFLRTAATMAAGVAGGALIAEGISSLFSGHSAGGLASGLGSGLGNLASGSPWGAQPTEVVENVTVNNYYDQKGGAEDASYGGGDALYNDASYDDGAPYDDGGAGSEDI